VAESDAIQSAEARAKGEALIQTADKLLCESWNERMWADGEPIDPSPTIDQAVNGGYSDFRRVALMIVSYDTGLHCMASRSNSTNRPSSTEKIRNSGKQAKATSRAICVSPPEGCLTRIGPKANMPTVL
jgi:hypothetical protein